MKNSDIYRINQQTQETPIQDYALWSWTSPHYELLYFLNIAIFCVLRLYFYFCLFSSKNEYLLFAFAFSDCLSSFASIHVVPNLLQ